jgi:tetratricopeptide (TPR) repeat protein
MRFLRLSALIFTLLPPYVAAQSAALAPAASRVADLLGKAEALTNLTDLPARARLFEEAAGLLPDTDLRAARALRSAAESYHKLGKPQRAMQLLERAAKQAASRGNPTEAADDYVAALFVALEIKSRANARRFIDRAIALTTSPAMPEGDRQRILRRLSQPATELGASQRPPIRRGVR